MTSPFKLALASLIMGAIMGLVVLGAAAAAGRPQRLRHWLFGTIWGSLTTCLTLTDCLDGGRPGPVSDSAFPLFFGAIVVWPVVLVWGQRRWFLRWLAAQLIMLVALGPGFLVAVTAALCAFQ